jgi:hypothetical protein
MEQAPHTPDRFRRLADLNSLLFSGVVHFSALIALGLWTAAPPDDWGGVKLRVNVGHGGELPSLDDSPLENVVQLQVAEAAAALGPVQLIDDLAVPASDFAALDPLSASAAKASGFAGLALGGNSEGDGTTALASTEFFGIGGYGQSFVYVVDCSE